MDDDETPVLPPKVEPARKIRRMRRAGDRDDRNGVMATGANKSWATLEPRRGQLPPPSPTPPTTP